VAKRRGEIDMGIVIEFPAGAALSRLGSTVDGAPRQGLNTQGLNTQGLGTILILPVVRIERHTDETSGGRGPEEGTAPGRRRRRRARS
jgi:hypothetical protein